MDPVPLPLHTIRAAFTELGRSVSVALRTQMGDTARLGVQKQPSTAGIDGTGK